MRSKPWLIVLAGLAALGMAAVLVQFSLQRTAELRVAELVERLPPEVEVSYGSVELGLFGRDLTVERVRLQPAGHPAIEVARIHLIEFDRHGRPPRYLKARASGVRQDLAALPPDQRQQLQALGYEELRADYSLEYRYERAAGELDVRHLRAELKEMAELTLAFRVSGLDPERAATDPQFHALELQLHALELRYTDRSLLPRIIRRSAQQQEISEAEVVEAMLARLDERLKPLKGAFSAQLRRELAQFLRDPQQLTLVARPARPVTAMDALAYVLVRPADLPELLNLSVEAD
jgi:hypothetical protein